MADKKNAPLPDHMIRQMLENPVLWMDRLRKAAIQRGAPHTSVTPAAEVLSWLRTDVHAIERLKLHDLTEKKD